MSRHDVAQVLITGRQGTGKSSLVRHILSGPAGHRAVALDPLGDDYHDLPRVDSYQQFARIYGELWAADHFQVRQTSHRTAEQLRTLELVYQTQKELDERPVLVVIEEASFFSGTGKIPGPVKRVITTGRHANISAVSVAQRSTQVNEDVQQSANLVVFFPSMKLSTWAQDILTSDQQRAIAQLKEVEGGERPERGVHYHTAPPGRDVEDELRKAVRE